MFQIYSCFSLINFSFQITWGGINAPILKEGGVEGDSPAPPHTCTPELKYKQKNFGRLVLLTYRVRDTIFKKQDILNGLAL